MQHRSVLGISAGVHDSAAALVTDGIIRAACKEERLTREKHAGHFPTNAIRFCVGTSPTTVPDVVAYYWQPWKGVLHRASVALRGLPDSLALISRQNGNRGTLWTLAEHFNAPRKLSEDLGLKCPFVFLDHDVCHASSAYYCSGLRTAAILTFDLSGEMNSVLASLGREGHISTLWSTKYPHSIGSMYATVTQYLGFTPNADEYKVMGLAGYGRPIYYGQLRDLVSLDTEGQFRLNLDYFVHHRGRRDFYSSRFVEAFGPPRASNCGAVEQRYADLASSVQKLTEELALHIARELRRATECECLCVGGGVALNGSVIHSLAKRSGFRKVFVPPSPDDSGTAIGAALLLAHRDFHDGIQHESTPFLGPSYTSWDIEQAIQLAGVKYEKITNIPRSVAELLAKGGIVGWFHGRMEFGPRALGNRSILADPRSVSIREILNSKVKWREPFRPFGASVTEDKAADYFKLEQPAPFMIEICKAHAAKASLIPAVIHVDGTCRPQTVSRSCNELFWDLIRNFEELTGIPVLLNTSFNLGGEPIVCSPRDALSAFIRSRLDYLSIGDFLVWR